MEYRYLITILAFHLCSTCLSGQPVIFINSGSRAPWGTTQELTIFKDGHATYYQNDLRSGGIDSLSFMLPKTSLDSLFFIAESSGFFTLKEKYDGGAADGSGIYISINSGGRIHSVDIKNEQVPGVVEMIRRFNLILAPSGKTISYQYTDNPKK